MRSSASFSSTRRLSRGEIVAIALVIGGVLLAILDDLPARRARTPAPGALYGLFAAAFHAVGLIVNKAAFGVLEALDGDERASARR